MVPVWLHQPTQGFTIPPAPWTQPLPVSMGLKRGWAYLRQWNLVLQVTRAGRSGSDSFRSWEVSIAPRLPLNQTQQGAI